MTGKILKTRKTGKIGYYILPVCLMLWVTGVYPQSDAADSSQAANTSNASGDNSSEKIYGNYMEIQVAKKSADILIKQNKTRLQQIKVAVRNFGEGDDQSNYDKLAAEYVEALKDYYKRNYLAADMALKENREGIVKLATSMSDKYRGRANEILDRCADALVETELGINPQPDSDPDAIANTYKMVQKNKIKLLIAYDQLNMGDEAIHQEQFAQSIVHYRMAKEHGIQLLINLAQTEDEKESLRGEFEKDTTDAVNRISSGS